ncbi:MAG: hypothetical protein ACOY3Z_06205 [Thermodesulfobacteriota bacterium]
MNENSPVIVLIVSTSFGEVDWILPPLIAFKKKHPEWKIVTLFGHQLVFKWFESLNPVLYRAFKEVSELNVVPQEIGALFRDDISPDQVRIVLKDYNEDQYAPYKQEILQRCPNALVVSYPHSNHIYSNSAVEPLQSCVDPDAFSVHDLFLLCSREDIPYWSRYVDCRKIRVFGYPRYDSWWIDRFLSDAALMDAQENIRAKAAGPVFFYISRGPHPHYLNQQDYEYLLRSTVEETLRHEKSFLLIKPHPRQDLDELVRILNDYDPSRWMISGLHLLQLASLADVVISGWSSGILDALAVNKPVIEFWRFGGNDPLCRYNTADGKPTTIYRELGLAAGADSRDEMASLLAQAVQDPDGTLWQAQRQAFRRYCKKTDSASMDIVNCLMEEVSRKQARLAPPVAGQPSPEFVESLIDFVTALADDGQDARVKEWLDFMAAQFPENPRVLGNMGVFLFNQGNFAGAVDKLAESLRQDPTSQENTVNLVHILLLLGKVDEAVQVVVSYQQTVGGCGPGLALLQVLREQVDDEKYAILQTRIPCSQGLIR